MAVELFETKLSRGERNDTKNRFVKTIVTYEKIIFEDEFENVEEQIPLLSVQKLYFILS